MPNKGTIPRVCETCGADFLAIAFQVKQGRARYCSTDCYFRARYGAPHRISVACLQCGTSFESWPSRLESGRGRYCSKRCSATANVSHLPIRVAKPTPQKPPRRPRSETFWQSIDASGGSNACWPWIRARNNTGYGITSFRPIRSKLAHRIAWIITNGPIPDTLNVLHQCDNPPCCNPSHLFTGSQADNNWDKIRKGRHRTPDMRGASNPAARLTEDDVRAIRTLRASGASYPSLGARFGISKTMVRNIVLRRAWSHVS